MQRCDARARSGQRESLDKPNHSWVCATYAGIGAWMQVKSAPATSSVEPEPALKSAGADSGFAGEGGKRDLVLDVESKDFPALFAV